MSLLWPKPTSPPKNITFYHSRDKLIFIFMLPVRLLFLYCLNILPAYLISYILLLLYFTHILRFLFPFTYISHKWHQPMFPDPVFFWGGGYFFQSSILTLLHLIKLNLMRQSFLIARSTNIVFKGRCGKIPLQSLGSHLEDTMNSQQ